MSSMVRYLYYRRCYIFFVARQFAGICGGDLDELDDFDVDNDEK